MRQVFGRGLLDQAAICQCPTLVRTTHRRDRSFSGRNPIHTRLLSTKADLQITTDKLANSENNDGASANPPNSGQ